MTYLLAVLCTILHIFDPWPFFRPFFLKIAQIWRSWGSEILKSLKSDPEKPQKCSKLRISIVGHLSRCPSSHKIPKTHIQYLRQKLSFVALWLSKIAISLLCRVGQGGAGQGGNQFKFRLFYSIQSGPPNKNRPALFDSCFTHNKVWVGLSYLN